MIIKTYLINDNGGIKIKEHVIRNIPKPKKTLNEKKNIRIERPYHETLRLLLLLFLT